MSRITGNQLATHNPKPESRNNFKYNMMEINEMLVGSAIPQLVTRNS